MKVKEPITTTTTTGREASEGLKEEDEEGKMGTGAEEKDVESGRTVVVGVRMDAQSKELLTWALVKVAEPGDRVVALHVLTKSSFCDDPDLNSPSSMISLVKSFDSMLSVYEGFCNLKQIDLKLKICRGSSIRKVLVREVNGFSAAKFIIGVTKSTSVIGSFSTSIAKYCARKLPKECWVVAVNNGKIVFQREAVVRSAHCSQSRETGSKKEKSPRFFNGTNGDLYSLLPTTRDGSAVDIGKESELPSMNNSPKQACSVCSPGSSPHREAAIEEESNPVPILVEGCQSPLSCFSPSAHSHTETRWPHIRKIIHHGKNSTSEKIRTLMAPWSMRSPSRYSTSAVVHPDRRSVKTNTDDRSPVSKDHVSVSTCNEVKMRELFKELEPLLDKYASTCMIFSYDELANATSRFSDENLIGRGGNSRVYKGCLSDGREVAVKLLKQPEDVVKEFVLEIEIITTLHHNKIISLIGFSFENQNLLLVYDFLSRGSLEQNLHDLKENETALNWADRYRIAVGIAEALDYLHSGSSGQPIIHRDVKSSNILLSDNFEPQLADFGLASLASSSSTQIAFSDVAGTFGYLAPEYFVFGKVNEKVDVYAFGVVLLELVSGRKPIEDDSPTGQQSLVMWAKPLLQSGKTKQLLDSSLGSEFDDDQLERMMLVASLCTIRSPRLRPKMAMILKLLRGDEETTKWARSQLSTSEEFEGLDEELITYPDISDIQSHLSLALLDVEEDMLSTSSESHNADYITSHGSLEAYLHERWSHSSSFH